MDYGVDARLAAVELRLASAGSRLNGAGKVVEQLVADALTEVYQAKPVALIDALSPRWASPVADDLVFEDDFDSVGV